MDGDTKMTHVGALTALRAGAAAARADEPTSACPHNPNGSLPDRFYAYWWCRGYARSRQLT